MLGPRVVVKEADAVVGSQTQRGRHRVQPLNTLMFVPSLADPR